MYFYHALFAAHSAVGPMTIIDRVDGPCFFALKDAQLW
jgi:hypothetical protein